MSANGWTARELERIGSADELHLASRRPDGTLRPAVTIWVVRVEDRLYVRSAHGPENGWFPRASASGSGHVRAAGVERDVTFTEAEDGVHGLVDGAYHAEYDHYGPRTVGAVVGAAAEAVSVRLVPHDS